MIEKTCTVLNKMIVMHNFLSKLSGNSVMNIFLLYLWLIGRERNADNIFADGYNDFNSIVENMLVL